MNAEKLSLPRSCETKKKTRSEGRVRMQGLFGHPSSLLEVGVAGDPLARTRCTNPQLSSHAPKWHFLGSLRLFLRARHRTKDSNLGPAD